MRDLVRRVERDELRVRWHPRDTLELQRFLAQQVRRALLALFAFTVAIIASVVYLATRRLEVLVLGPADRLRDVPGHLPAADPPVPEPAPFPPALAGTLSASRVALPASGAASRVDSSSSVRDTAATAAIASARRTRSWPRWPAPAAPASENSTTWRWLLIRSRSKPADFGDQLLAAPPPPAGAAASEQSLEHAGRERGAGQLLGVGAELERQRDSVSAMASASRER